MRVRESFEVSNICFNVLSSDIGLLFGFNYDLESFSAMQTWPVPSGLSPAMADREASMVTFRHCRFLSIASLIPE